MTTLLLWPTSCSTYGEEQSEQFPAAFEDDFSVDTRADYQVNGNARWADSSLTLMSGASIVRRVKSEADFEVAIDLTPDPNQQGDAATQIHFAFSGGRQIIVAIVRRKSDDNWSEQVELADLRSVDGRSKPSPHFLRRFPPVQSQTIQTQWKLKYKAGVLHVFRDDESVGTAFSGCLGAWCHAVVVGQRNSKVALQTIRFSGTETRQTPEQAEVHEEINRLKTRAASSERLGLHSARESFLRDQLKLFDEHFGENYYASGVELQSLAECYDQQSRLEDAAKTYREAAHVFSISFGNDHPEAIRSRILACDAASRGENAVSDDGEMVKDLMKLMQLAGCDCEHSKQALTLAGNTLQRWATQAHTESDYETYQRHLEEFLEIQTMFRDGQSERYQYYLDELSYAKLINSADAAKKQALIDIDQFYTRLADIRQKGGATPLAQEKELYQACLKHLGNDHSKTLSLKTNLAIRASNGGDAGRALQLLKEVFETTERLYGKEHLCSATAAYQLASIYSIVQRKEEADRLFDQANTLMESDERSESYEYALGLHLYGRHLKRVGRFRDALDSLNRAQAILVKQDRNFGPLSQSIRTHLADTYRAMGEARKAKQLLDEQRRILEKSGGEDATAKYDVAFSEAIQLLWENRTEEALEKHQHAKQLAIELFGRNSRPHYAVLDSELKTRVGIRDSVGAGRLVREMIAFEDVRRQTLFQVYSAAEQFERSAVDRKSLDRIMLLVRNGLLKVKDGYHMVLAAKGNLLQYQRAQATVRRNPKLKKEVQQLQDVTSRLAGLLGDTENTKDVEIDQLVATRDEILKRIAEKGPSTFGPWSASSYEMDGVAAILGTLPPGTVVIDFVHFLRPSLLATLRGRDEMELGAFIYSDHREIEFVRLGPAAPIEEKTKQWVDAIKSGSRGGGSSVTGDDEHTIDQLGEELRQLVWDPLFPSGETPARVFVSPDGPLTQCPLSALPTEQGGHYLVESCAISYTIAPRLMIQGDPGSESIDDRPNMLLLVGDIDYGDVKNLRSARYYFSELAEANRELASIAEMFDRQMAGSEIVRLTGQNATEAMIRDRVPGAGVVHILSHGFYLPIEDSGVDSQDRHPTSRAGLAVSNANRGINAADEGNGVLWADELAMLDFTHAKLVVLSACDTAAGTEAPGEGLLSLQRALATAGAESSVTTLWSIENLSTIALMQHFYRHLLIDGADVSEAVRLAKVSLIKQGIRESGTGSSRRLPIRQWAPFVVFGNPTVEVQP
ncbi:CHAT domain-containing protein [Stieleria magnilauensis]|uniref:CHAT domain-containing protein n=1 Tax=Stieleria magnilauensis TaxID=2527963 RepID=UPI003AF7BE9A